MLIFSKKECALEGSIELKVDAATCLCYLLLGYQMTGVDISLEAVSRGTHHALQ